MAKEREDFAARFSEALRKDPQYRALESRLAAEERQSEAASGRIHDLAATEIRVLSEKAPLLRPEPRNPGPPVSTSGWTLEAFMEHFRVIRIDDHRFYEERFLTDQRFHAERDRRLTEVAVEREKALKIKETADLAALQLAREIQTYKDEKANELREQIGSERGLYATKENLSDVENRVMAEMKPALDYVNRQAGRKDQEEDTRGVQSDVRQIRQGVNSNVGMWIALVVAVLIFVSVVVAVVVP